MLASVVAVAVGCDSDSPTGPRSRAVGPPRSPAFDVASVALGAPANTALPDYGMPQPIKIDYRILPGQTVRLRATTALQIRGEPACGGYLDPVTVDPNGGWIPIYTPPPGQPEAEWNLRAFLVDSTVTVTSALTSTIDWHVGKQYWAEVPGGGAWLRYATNTYTDRSLYAWVGRTGEINWDCETPTGQVLPGTLISGSQIIAVEPVLFKVNVTPNAFGPFRFTVETDVTAASLSWTFSYTAGGSVSVTACSNQLVCDFTPTAKGRMQVQLVEAVTSTSMTARSVEVQPCPPPADSLLQDKAFRDSLNALLQDSNPNATPDTLRRERGAIYLEDKVTGERTFVRINDPNATNCSTNNSPNHDFTRYVLLATIHTHPYTPGEFVRFCGSKAFNQNYMPGSSSPDYNGLILDNFNYRAVQNNRWVREYTIDKWTVNRTKIDGGISDEKLFYHSNAGCRWYPQ